MMKMRLNQGISCVCSILLLVYMNINIQRNAQYPLLLIITTLLNDLTLLTCMYISILYIAYVPDFMSFVIEDRRRVTFFREYCVLIVY